MYISLILLVYFLKIFMLDGYDFLLCRVWSERELYEIYCLDIDRLSSLFLAGKLGVIYPRIRKSSISKRFHILNCKERKGQWSWPRSFLPRLWFCGCVKASSSRNTVIRANAPHTANERLRDGRTEREREREREEEEERESYRAISSIVYEYCCRGASRMNMIFASIVHWFQRDTFFNDFVCYFDSRNLYHQNFRGFEQFFQRGMKRLKIKGEEFGTSI